MDELTLRACLSVLAIEDQLSDLRRALHRLDPHAAVRELASISAKVENELRPILCNRAANAPRIPGLES